MKRVFRSLICNVHQLTRSWSNCARCWWALDQGVFRRSGKIYAGTGGVCNGFTDVYSTAVANGQAYRFGGCWNDGGRNGLQG